MVEELEVVGELEVVEDLELSTLEVVVVDFVELEVVWLFEICPLVLIKLITIITNSSSRVTIIPIFR